MQSLWIILFGLSVSLLIRGAILWLQEKSLKMLFAPAEWMRVGITCLCSALAIVWLAARFLPDVLRFVCVVFIMMCLGIVFETDRTDHRIFSLPVGCLAVCGLFYNLVLNQIGWQTLVVGMALGAGFFGIQYLVSCGRAMGMGDLFLGIALGGLFGWSTLLFVLLVSYVVGASISLLLLALKRMKRQDAVPLGSYLALGSIFALCIPPSWVWFGLF